MTDAHAAPIKKPAQRLEALDGLRGLAAVVVFAHHALVLLYGPLAGVNMRNWPARPQIVFEAMQHTPVAWLFNGTFAVSFFFVLSGFVLTRAMGTAPKAARVARLVTTRFLRLSPLVVLGTALSFAAFGISVRHLDMLLPLTGNDSTSHIHPALLAQHGIAVALKQALFGIWRGAEAGDLFDPPLWSIGYELKGSLLIYLLGGAFAQTPRRNAKYYVGVPLGIIFMGPATLSFLAGMYIAERSREHDDNILPVGRNTLIALVALALSWASVHPWNRHLWLPLPFNPPELVDTAISTACSVFLMAAGLQWPSMRRVLQTRLVQFLGHASYGLYIIHVPLLYVLCGPLLTPCRAYMGMHAAALTTSSIVLGLALYVGGLLIRYVDTPIAQWSKNKVAAWLDDAG